MNDDKHGDGHSYLHLLTRCELEQTRYTTYWKRIDEFYCTKCLTIKKVALTADGEQPDWWIDKDDIR